jgi:hypothetical protein
MEQPVGKSGFNNDTDSIEELVLDINAGNHRCLINTLVLKKWTTFK